MTELDDDDLGRLLVGQDLLATDALARARRAAVQTGTPLETSILELGLLSEDVLYAAAAEHMGLPFLPADRIDVPRAAATLREADLPAPFLDGAALLPLALDEGRAQVATGRIAAGDALRALAYRLDAEIDVSLAAPSAIRAVLAKAREESTEDADGAPAPEAAGRADVERLQDAAEEGPIVRLVSDLVAAAVQARASDIHVEATASGADVRLRVDGLLQPHRTLAPAEAAAVASRLKVMAGLSITERRRPQDGRLTTSVRGERIDLRLSSLPTPHGESIVLRVIGRAKVAREWSELGFPPDQAAELDRLLSAEAGLFLIAGPTGSGKTTTLYTALTRLASPERKIVTVEDPIEVELPGVVQVQVEPAAGLTFAAALRAILRHDPNVVMVGEIRDEETAQIAARAALIGRLVLSTIHTEDGPSTITRLTDLGVPRYLVDATLRGVLSQRLARVSCEACGGSGCEPCSRTGTKERTVVGEVWAPH